VPDKQPENDPFLDELAREIVSRRLGPAAIMALEAGKPMTFVGSQFLVFMDPILKLFVSIPHYQKFVEILEDRDRVEKLIQAIERAENSTPS